MRIVFLITQNPNSLRDWSGTTFYIYQALRKHHTVHLIGVGILENSIQYISNNFTESKRLDCYSAVLANICSERINRLDEVDLVFFGDIYLNGLLKISIPSIVYTDSMFAINNSQRPSKDQFFVKRLKSLEASFFKKSDFAVFSSQWINKKAIGLYNLNYNKTQVIEFGANLPHPENYQAEIDTSICHIIFIGREWTRKGGNITFEAIRILQNQGFPCKMTFIGCTPPPNESLPENTEIIPFLDKSKPEELERLCSILYDAHFLLLPTRFEPFGIVFAEASAYGVPSIATNVGGTSQAIREGKNGFLLPLEAGAEEYANKIKEVFADKESYYQLRRTSRKEYETRLNWDVWLKRVNKVFEETVSNYKKQNNKNE